MQYILILFLIVFCVASSTNLPKILVDPNTNHFVDEFGRVRLFHGVNVVYKVPPFLPNLTDFDPQNSLTPDDLANLNQWGFNVIRFYAAWMGVYPHSSTEVNYEYLAQLSKTVSMMEDHDIYSLLDCHQDIFSRFFCGEGVPDWLATLEGNQTLAAFPFPLALNITRDVDTGYPVLEECLKRSFSAYYLTDAVANGFKML